QPAEDLAPPRIVVDHGADGVEHVPALGIHVPRAALVHAVGAHDRGVVLHAGARADHVGGARLLAEEALGEDAFGVVREALVHPHVGVILYADAVPPPLVRALVHDDEIPL